MNPSFQAEYQAFELIKLQLLPNIPTTRFPWCALDSGWAEAKDIFQESILIIYEQLKSEKFKGESSIDTNFYTVCKRIWIRQLHKKDKQEQVAKGFQEESLMVAEDDSFYSHINLSSMLMKISDTCRAVLTDFYFYNQTMNEIREKYKLGSLGAAKNKKYRCMQQLMAYAKTYQNNEWG